MGRVITIIVCALHCFSCHLNIPGAVSARILCRRIRRSDSNTSTGSGGVLIPVRVH